MTTPADPATARPRPEVVLRALRDARGLTQQGWAALLGYSVATVRRWESGSALPNADTQDALIAACAGWGLFRTFSQGPLRGVTLTPDLLRDLLAEARLGSRHVAEPELDQPIDRPALPSSSPVQTFGQPSEEVAEHAHNLPVTLTSFVGREHELDEVKRLLRGARLVTLTGSGGAGKTRLAINVAGQLLEEYPHGVWLVELAPLVDPALVPQAVAAALGLREQPGRPLLGSLVDHLRTRTLLLVLDNCEHVVAACAELMDTLLRACPNLHVLATSREALNIAGETAWRVPSLATPDPGRTLAIEQIGQYPAVRLLVDRARAGQPDFALTRQNATAVAQLCWRLDGMPLALELAAARVKLLSVEEIAQRLDDRFGFLTAGSRTALPRQQTLRAAVDWSYELLSEDERQVLQRLSVFAGGWTLEAAEAVAGAQDDELDVVDLLARLLDKSLVVREPDDGEARFGFLETIRAYARIKLLAADEARQVRDRHLAWCVALVDRARPYLVGRTQSVWLGRLDREHDNVRAGLRWAFEQGQLDAALRICGAFWRYWWLRGSFREGRAWLNEVLERRADDADPIAVARVLEGAGLAAFDSGELPLAERRFDEALKLRRTAGDPAGIGTALGWLSFVVMERGDDQRGIALADEGLAMARQSGDAHTIAAAVIRLGRHLTLQGEPARVLTDLEQALQTVRRLDDVFLVCVALSVLGDAQQLCDDLDRAARLYAECVRLRRAHHMLGTNPSALFGWSDVLRRQDLLPEAHALCGEGVRLAHDFGVTRDVALGLRALGSVAVDEGDAERGVMLCAASQAIVEPLGMHLGRVEQQRLASTLTRAEAQLGEPRFVEARTAGAALSVDEAVTFALSAPA